MKRKITLTIIIFLVVGIALILVTNKDTEIEKNEERKNNSSFISMMYEQEDGKYVKSSDRKWPIRSYVFNAEKSYCKNNSVLEWNNVSKKVKVKVKGTDKCYVYFDLEELGTEESPYKIRVIEDLVDLANEVNNGENYAGKVFRLEKDLDFTNPDDYENAYRIDYGDLNNINGVETLINELTNPNGSGFTPIGKDATNSFQGIFDGNNNKIENLYINNSILERIGLFGTVNNGTVMNLIIVGNFNSKISTIMGMIGITMGTTTIKNCQNNINMLSSIGTGSIGGFIGENNGNLTISNSQNYGNLTGGTKVGGLIGMSKAPTNIKNSSNMGNINVDNKLTGNNLGGLIGLINDKVDIKNSYNSGTITENMNQILSRGEFNNVGGLIGKVEIINLSKISTIISSYNTQDGNIKGTICGGLIGFITNNSKIIIDKSYNMADVEAVNEITQNSNRVGGLIGYNGAFFNYVYILNSYNLGNITNKFYGSDNLRHDTGGFIGQNWASFAYIINSYNQGNLSSLDYVGNIIGYSSYDKNTVYNASLLINNVYTIGNLSGTNKHTIGTLIDGEYTINNLYHLPEFTSSYGSTTKNIDEIKSQEFIDELNQNIENINLEEIDPLLKDYKLSKWTLGSDGYPTLLNE